MGAGQTSLPSGADGLIARLELGQTDPRLSTLERLAEAFEVSLVEMLSGPAVTPGPRRVRRLLQGPDILMAPGCFDPVSALLAEQAGFSALYLTGTGLASHVVDERVD